MFNHGFQGLTFDKLHHDKVHALGFFDCVDGNDVWMIEGRSSLRLFQKATLGGEIVIGAGRQKFELGKSLLTVKMFYQILMALLVFIGLIFIVPSIRFSSVATQLEYELRKHMKRRYENDFSFEFLDSIQAEYECCDELWYRANLNDRLPLSCFQSNNLYNIIHEQVSALKQLNLNKSNVVTQHTITDNKQFAPTELCRCARLVSEQSVHSDCGQFACNPRCSCKSHLDRHH